MEDTETPRMRKYGELWWQLYRTSLPVWDLENFRPMDFCWYECTKNLWILHVWKNSFFQAASESVACAFYQLETLYQSIRFLMLSVQKYDGTIKCNISKYFSRWSFFIFSQYRWLLTSVVSNWVYIRINLYKQASSKL